MNLNRKAKDVARMLLQRYGSERTKRHLWNKEFLASKWNCLDSSGEDGIQFYVEKYADRGDVLDLGCGSGTTGINLDPASYSFYTGVDVSDVALNKAVVRSRAAGIADRVEFLLGDILTFEPNRRYNVILFGDSIYYVGLARILPVLRRYGQYLNPKGVFAVRLFDVSGKLYQIVECIESHFSVLEKHINEQTHVCNVVFRLNDQIHTDNQPHNLHQ